MNLNLKLYLKGAQSLGLPTTVIPDLGVRVDLGMNIYYFIESMTPLNEGGSYCVSLDKYLGNKILEKSGFPVPKAVTFDQTTWQKNSLSTLLKNLQFPVVAKPVKETGRGAAVFCNIINEDRLNEYLFDFFKYFPKVQIEEFLQPDLLREYRVLIIHNKVCGVVERFSAHVVGDGVHTIEQLIALANEERLLLSETLTISPMVYDQEYEECLIEQGLSLQSIPENGQKIRLCYTVNTGRGGTIYSLGKQIHPENARKLIKAAQALGLNFAGLDILCEDINRPFNLNQWMIIEINYRPDITIHEIPNQGKKAPVMRIVFWQLIRKHLSSYCYQLIFKSHYSIYFKATIALIGVLSLFWVIGNR